jgi:DNA-binding NtrC family response regulator
MARVRALVDLVASSRLSVILLGETGVGKEVTARAIRDRSPLAKGPFVAVNCAALAESLLDTELFGYEKGAFTGAASARAGLIEAADGGTLFLDEIAEAPAGVQAKLLRTVETREVRRVGGTGSRSVDVRFIAASNRDLPRLVQAGSFRRDLYFRLNGITIVIPPLRERKDEIHPLALRFIAEACAASGRPAPRLSPAALAALEAHSFPGNVRELRSIVERAVVLCPGGDIAPEHLVVDAPPPASADADADAPPPASADDAPSRSEAPPAHGAPHADERARDRERILAALDRTGGNQTRAAALLGIGRRTLIHRMESYELPRPRKG